MPHADFTETEVKLFVPDLQAVTAALEAIGATLSAPRVFERNLRLDTPARDLSSARKVLRLRQDSRARLTYKDEGQPSGTEGILSRFEAEVEIDDLDRMALILARLGYTPYMQYEKYRTTYTLNDAEIVLDEMPYGNFVEIEGDYDTIQALIAQLGLSAAKRLPQSYTALFETVRAALNLTFTDLTFANFEGVSVPVSIFENL